MDRSLEEMNVITEKIISCAYKVSNNLGAGFLEKVYENAMVIEFKKNGIKVEQQYPIKIYYDDKIVGDYIADLLVENEVIIELKTAKNIDEIHKAQLLNYLKATNKKIGLIINFYKPKIEIKRMINDF